MTFIRHKSANFLTTHIIHSILTSARTPNWSFTTRNAKSFVDILLIELFDHDWIWSGATGSQNSGIHPVFGISTEISILYVFNKQI